MSTESADGQESTECPTCGRDDFAGVAGMKRHHAAAHGESIAGVVVTCEVCDDDFRVKPRDGDTARFCSLDCKHEGQRQGNIVECENCGDRVYRPPSHTGRFCSQECMKEAFRGEGHPAYDPDVTVCLGCGDSFEHKPSHDRKYCSEDCMAKDYLGRMSGSGNPNWEGGRAEYGPGWTEEKRRAVRERDGYECRGCGMSQQEHIDLIGRKLDVHHIVPARTFDDPEERNAKNNLVSLCMWCHQQWEQMAPLRPTV